MTVELFIYSVFIGAIIAAVYHFGFLRKVMKYRRRTDTLIKAYSELVNKQRAAGEMMEYFMDPHHFLRYKEAMAKAAKDSASQLTNFS